MTSEEKEAESATYQENLLDKDKLVDSPPSEPIAKESNDAGERSSETRRTMSASRRWIIASFGILVPAVAAAVAAAIISPERFDQFVDWIVGRDEADYEQEVTYKQVGSEDGALVVDVPATWFSAKVAPNFLEPDEEPDPGTGLLASTRLETAPHWGEDSVFFAASSVAAERLDLGGKDARVLQAWVDQQAKKFDWGLDRCILARDKPRSRDGWFVASRMWSSCAGVQGTRLWEYFAIAEDGHVALGIVVTLSPDASSQIAERIFDTWEVASERLPTIGPTGGDYETP